MENKMKRNCKDLNVMKAKTIETLHSAHYVIMNDEKPVFTWLLFESSRLQMKRFVLFCCCKKLKNSMFMF